MPHSGTSTPKTFAIELHQMIDAAVHLLPVQGPIEVFVHHNTLHALEKLPFHDAVRHAKQIHNAEPYLSEKRFSELLANGRILKSDLRAVLAAEFAGSGRDVAETIAPGLVTRFDFQIAVLVHPINRAPASELKWVIAETDALEMFRQDIDPGLREALLRETRNQTQDEMSDSILESRAVERLWNACCNTTRQCNRSRTNGLSASDQPTHSDVRPRDSLLASTGIDTDELVHQVLIPFTAAFLDQGYADWSLPDRDRGFLHSFYDLYCKRSIAGEVWMDGLAKRLVDVHESGFSSGQSIERSMLALGIPQDQWSAFITQTLLALPGWAGMVQQLEKAPGWVVRPVPEGTLEDFFAVRLILDEAAAKFVAEEHLGFRGAVCHVAEEAVDRAKKSHDDSLEVAFVLFQIAQVLGWNIETLTEHADSIVQEIAAFDEISRQRIFHEAYERGYRNAALDAVAKTFVAKRDHSTNRPSFQLCTCIDDREESLRRHLEEVDADCETFGAAGFYAIAMNYRGAADASFKPLCPATVTPGHYVTENVGYTFSGNDERRAEARRRLGRLTHRVHSGSRTFLGGIATSMLGSLAAFPLVARVLFPRLTSQMRRRLGSMVAPPPVTQLQLHRYQEPPGGYGGHIGYSLPEMVDVVEHLLHDIGLTEKISKLFVVTGHGSSSVNNPHASAYNCGACAGKRGGPNARAFAQMANDFRVRRELVIRGITIPEDTWFLGTYHNTCDDSIGWFDLDRMPPSHHQVFEQTKQTCDEAILRNAHERCRRFEAADVNWSNKESLRHVQQRSEDLSQVRPEYNHATNALCFVGRREWSRGLFLDRRAFLTSYDPAQDDESGTILARILAAAIPVCAGISLEYYFSSVDNIKYGSGSKLPHNLVSMLGVMEGAASDLRTGLYHQMIEIHEPMRILFVIETTPAIMKKIIAGNESIGRLCDGAWVQLALTSPDDGTQYLYQSGKFVVREPSNDPLPTAATSKDWYFGDRENLGFALIKPKPEGAGV